MNAAKENHIGRSLLRLEGQPQRVADEIRHVLKFRHLIVVREDDRVLELLQLANAFLKFGGVSRSNHRCHRHSKVSGFTRIVNAGP